MTFVSLDALVSNASHQNIEGNLTIAGILTVTTLDLTSLTVSDSISIGGTLTYEDVTNVDSIGIITARTDLHVGGRIICGREYLHLVEM